MKIRLMLGLALLLLLGCLVFIAQKKFEARGTTILRFAYASNPAPVKEAINRFIADVESSSNGRIKFLLFPDGQLGGERELVELIQVGAIDFTKVSAGLLESFVPVYGVFSLPYLFDSEQHFYRSMHDAQIMDPIYQSTSSMNFVGLTWYDSGQRSFYTKNRPIRRPEDLRGLKIRVMQNQTSMRTVSLLGASPIAMNNAETYSAIQQGIIDGAENNEFALTVPRHGEVAKQYSYDMHTRIPDIVLAYQPRLAQMKSEDRALIMAAAERSTESQTKAWQMAIASAREKSRKEQGVVFHEEINIKAFQKAVSPIYEGLSENPAAQAAFRQIRAAAQF